MPHRGVGLVTALALAAGVPSAGCAFAVDHPPATVGIAGAALGFATCKLESDHYGTCGLIGGGVGAGLAAIAALALWLGGDGHTVLVDDQAQPLPDDGRPIVRHPAPAATPLPAAPADPAAPATPAAPVAPASPPSPPVPSATPAP
ncbi:MAG TPA: hypothetical protein VFP84_30690 [Kofleriaceae bacterium]|nr:hypothetical protein [Kofleriaceae bacterium]